ncbi:hypothetical protein JTB14_023091 [Gonioctena quinquepunctata]|nr:hypothetical protein JTB14_023091 [Gonioctena quinquepunctata]
MEYMDKEKFKEEMERMLLPRDRTPQNLTKTIRKAQTKATASERDRITKQPYWGKKEEMKRHTRLTRTRTRDPHDRAIVEQETELKTTQKKTH